MKSPAAAVAEMVIVARPRFSTVTVLSGFVIS